MTATRTRRRIPFVPSRAGLGAVFVHQLRRMGNRWSSVIIAGLASPTMVLFAIGAGLGSQIDEAELASLGVDSYIDYIGPGLLVITAMQVASLEAMWPTMGLLRWGGIYKATLATPITAAELGAGHVLWLGFRIFVGSVCFLAVLALAGTTSSWAALAVPLVAVLIAWVHAGLIVALTVGLQNEQYFALISRVIVFPLYLFSGSFFPVEDMPSAIAAFARVTPAWHGVEVARQLAAGNLTGATALHLLYLAVLSVVALIIVQRQFRKHLDV